MERNEISIHEVKVYLALKNGQRWMSNQDIAKELSSIAARTVRAHTLKLVNLGILDQAEVFPGHRYRWSEKGVKRNISYVKRLEGAAEVFGVK